MFKALSLLAASELGGAVSRNVRAVPYFALGVLALLIGSGFLLDLAHAWLSLRMSPMAASGVLAAVLFTVAGIFLLVGLSIKNRRQPQVSPLTTSALIAAPFAARFLGTRLRFGTVAVAGVVAAGAVLGRFLGRA
jgi:hypothetical protein